MDFQLQPLLSLYVLPVVMMPPEVATTSWRSVFEKEHVKKNLALVAFDEAHCICEWLLNSISQCTVGVNKTFPYRSRSTRVVRCYERKSTE